MRNTAQKIIEKQGPKKPTSTDEYVGVAMRSRRMELGLSQIDLAKAIGVTFQQVQKYEKGTNRVGAGRLSKIANALQVPVTYFFQVVNGPDSPEVKPRTLESLKLPGASALLGHYANIKDPAHRKAVVDLARSLARQAGGT